MHKKPDVITRGISLGSQEQGNNDRLCTFFTGDLGKIRVFVNRARRASSGRMAACCTLAYSHLELRYRNGAYSVSDITLMDSFWGLHQDVEKLAVAMYYSQLAERLIMENEESSEQLRLMLNCLKFLENGRFSPQILKAAFELRLLSMSGFLPDLSLCSGCGFLDINKEGCFFCPTDGVVLCEKCHRRQPPRRAVRISGQTLEYMRLICHGSRAHMFNVNLSGEDLRQLCRATETYMLCVLQYEPEMLRLYRSVANEDF